MAQITNENGWQSKEPKMKFSNAILVIVLLHVLAIIGLLIFWFKGNQHSQMEKTLLDNDLQIKKTTPIKLTNKDKRKNTAKKMSSRKKKNAEEQETLFPEDPEITFSNMDNVRALFPNEFKKKNENLPVEIPVDEIRKLRELIEPNFIMYKVKRGDSLASIGQKFGTSKEKILQLNKSMIKNSDLLQIGQGIKIPLKKNKKNIFKNKKNPASTRKIKRNVKKNRNANSYFYYKIRRGDTIYGIAKKFRVTGNNLLKLNRIKKPKELKVGTTLKIPR